MKKKQSASEKYLGSLRVMVTKPVPDSRNSLCGEPRQTDGEGNEFFIIPAHQAAYQKAIHPQYEFGEEFVPGDSTLFVNSVLKKAEERANEPEEQPVKPKRGNPNWSKKHDQVEEEINA